MNNQSTHNLNLGKKLLLAAALAGPLLVGMMNGSQILKAQPLTQRRFDVASIKPAAPNARGIFIRPIAGGIAITNMPVKELIVIAYRVQLFQISGGPPWINSEHYDISAKSEDPPKRGEIPLMLQALLADRFQLAIHRETKELPIYALVLARKDGKLGPKLIESKGNSCTAVDPNKPPPPPEPGKPPVLPCGGMMMRPNALRAASIYAGDLTQNFSRLLGQTVVDKTGLTGKYDISMDWTPDESQAAGLPGPPPSPHSEPGGPSFFTAIREQLGLKLEAQKGPVETIVIDRVEKPSAN
ncbi:MAG TPA: TIGR03435 family protein [Bryobacteraceae bacterium]|nr:TIGR03435 family protein [Bryobacteraceae bacterium]